MKEKYEKPSTEINNFNLSDVITTSQGSTGTGGLTPSGWTPWY